MKISNVLDFSFFNSFCVPFCLLLLISCSGEKKNVPGEVEEIPYRFEHELPDVPRFLSEYRMFEIPLQDMKPGKGVIPYDLNASLFSDYAFKKRFIFLPEGKSMDFHCEDIFDFPAGSLIFKFFYYPKDFRKPDAEIRIVETRVLENKNGNWIAYTYIWNEEQTDAELALSGDNIDVAWQDLNGAKQNIQYSVPNIIQCKHCHEKSGAMVPIGPAGKHLNKDYAFSDIPVHQLRYFTETGILKGWNKETHCISLIDYEKERTGSLTDRARSYLDINCGHCHRQDGSARNSGLYLTYEENEPYRLGIRKPPVAAGRGSGGLKFDITPGIPHESILLFRMQSMEPGVMMPESGRKLVHAEGVQLISEWIKNLN